MMNKYGSLEVFFTYPSDTDKVIELVTNIQGLKQWNVGTAVLAPISIKVTSTKDGSDPVFIQVQTLINDVVVDQSDFSTYNTTETTFSIRIFFFDAFVSVNLNNKWIYSYAFAQIEYDEGNITAAVKLHGATTTITNLRRVELADGREAVYVDYESNTENGIQSIIQQRPILVQPAVGRALSFTYQAERDTINAVYVGRYTERHTLPSSLSSDGLIYGNDVSVSIDLETARDVGFITRLYRLPELTTGANAAAATLQKRARETMVQATVEARLDPRVMLSDVLNLDLIVKGTNRHIEKQVIVENIQIGLRDGEASMTITGRTKT